MKAIATSHPGDRQRTVPAQRDQRRLQQLDGHEQHRGSRSTSTRSALSVVSRSVPSSRREQGAADEPGPERSASDPDRTAITASPRVTVDPQVQPVVGGGRRRSCPGNSMAWMTPMNSNGTLVSTAAPAKPAAVTDGPPTGSPSPPPGRCWPCTMASAGRDQQQADVPAQLADDGRGARPGHRCQRRGGRGGRSTRRPRRVPRTTQGVERPGRCCRPHTSSGAADDPGRAVDDHGHRVPAEPALPTRSRPRTKYTAADPRPPARGRGYSPTCSPSTRLSSSGVSAKQQQRGDRRPVDAPIRRTRTAPPRPGDGVADHPGRFLLGGDEDARPEDAPIR